MEVCKVRNSFRSVLIGIDGANGANGSTPRDIVQFPGVFENQPFSTFRGFLGETDPEKEWGEVALIVV